MVWRTRQRRIHAVLYRHPRSQRLWILLGSAQEDTRRPRGRATERLELKRVRAERPETEWSRRRAPVFLKRLEAEEARNSGSGLLEREAPGFAETSRITCPRSSCRTSDTTACTPHNVNDGLSLGKRRMDTDVSPKRRQDWGLERLRCEPPGSTSVREHAEAPCS